MTEATSEFAPVTGTFTIPDVDREGEYNWNVRFMELAKHISKWSKDPSSKIGAVIVDADRRIVSTGFNGFPRGVVDYVQRLENRELKYKMILHAEENAIMFAKQNLEGCSLYVTNMPPCSHCAALIIQSGIKHVYVSKGVIPERWKESIAVTKQMFLESEVKMEFI